MKSIIYFFLFAVCLSSIYPQEINNKIVIKADSAKGKINRNIYGQFTEHLGRCIYGGIWVGKNSSIPNTRGIRNDVVKALKDISVPNVRWPGGCFADTYHWMDGIGPQSERKKIVNTTWGGVVEDNSFGTHEFMDFCGQVGCEPVICGNLGSGTIKEMVDWVEYLTSDGTPMADLRKKNGREKPWKVKFWGVGNESWGCGGLMSPDFYASELRKCAVFLKNYGDNTLYKVASGPNSADYAWTEELMKQWSTTDGWLKPYMNGLSLHYYTICHDWSQKGSALNFSKDDWFSTLSKTLMMDELVTKHSAVMDKYDPQKNIGLIVDEWGNWFDPEPGTNPAFLYQQNSLRDALTASLNFDIFNNHADRVKMANIAQMINVIQSIILTKDNQMVLTPTYYAFKMYKVHMDAALLPAEVSCEKISRGEYTMPVISASASKDSLGLIHITVTNLDPDNSKVVNCNVEGLKKVALKRGEIITAQKMDAYNDFGKQEEVNIKEFKDVKIKDNNLIVNMPAKSIVMIELKQ